MFVESESPIHFMVSRAFKDAGTFAIHSAARIMDLTGQKPSTPCWKFVVTRSKNSAVLVFFAHRISFSRKGQLMQASWALMPLGQSHKLWAMELSTWLEKDLVRYGSNRPTASGVARSPLSKSTDANRPLLDIVMYITLLRRKQRTLQGLGRTFSG